MSRTNCVYCGQEITTRSREHVIHNALGGLYESVDICCPGCNNYISRCIDVPFAKIFNPIIGQIQNFSKTNKTALPPCTGRAMYNGKIYNVGIKGTRVASCPQLSRELRCDISKIPMEIVSYDFNVDNTAFGTGIAKIAFNYALDREVDLKLLKHGLTCGKDGINFNYPIVPFYPMNPIDEYLEMGTKPMLYHNMILFSQEHKLWCYVDLFNTFQYYILLSDKMPAGTKIHHTYAQTVQKIDRTLPPRPELTCPNEIMIYAKKYGVKPCMDMDMLHERVKASMAQKSQKMSMRDIIAKQIDGMPMFYLMTQAKSDDKMMRMHMSYMLYFDQMDRLNEQTFRTETFSADGRCRVSYPDAINAAICNGTDALRAYTNAKFSRLNSILCKQK